MLSCCGLLAAPHLATDKTAFKDSPGDAKVARTRWHAPQVCPQAAAPLLGHPSPWRRLQQLIASYRVNSRVAMAPQCAALPAAAAAAAPCRQPALGRRSAAVVAPEQAARLSSRPANPVRQSSVPRQRSLAGRSNGGWAASCFCNHDATAGAHRDSHSQLYCSPCASLCFLCRLQVQRR